MSGAAAMAAVSGAGAPPVLLAHEINAHALSASSAGSASSSASSPTKGFRRGGRGVARLGEDECGGGGEEGRVSVDLGGRAAPPLSSVSEAASRRSLACSVAPSLGCSVNGGPSSAATSVAGGVHYPMADGPQSRMLLSPSPLEAAAVATTQAP
jgi:hypothetical protein